MRCERLRDEHGQRCEYGGHELRAEHEAEQFTAAGPCAFEVACGGGENEQEEQELRMRRRSRQCRDVSS